MSHPQHLSVSNPQHLPAFIDQAEDIPLLERLRLAGLGDEEVQRELEELYLLLDLHFICRCLLGTAMEYNNPMSHDLWTDKYMHYYKQCRGQLNVLEALAKELNI